MFCDLLTQGRNTGFGIVRFCSRCHTAMLSVRCVATFSRVNEQVPTIDKKSQRSLWAFRLLWLVLPFTTGPIFGEALDPTQRPFQLGVTLLLWGVWAVVLVLSMVPRTQTLTVLRIISFAGFAGLIWATIDSGDSVSVALIPLAIATMAFAAFTTISGDLGDAFVDGSSYGDETRFLLSTPGALMLGPIQLVWLVIVAGAVVGPLLLLAQQYVIGVVALIIGWALVFFAVPIVHRLSNRWLVFVPAGVVVHDKTALREPQLFRKETVAAFGPAPVGCELEDLSLGGLGLALRAELKESSKISGNSRDDSVELTDIDGFIVSPNRPGAVIAEAKRRGFDIG